MPLGTFRMAGSGLFPLCLGIILMLLALLYLGDLLLHRGATGHSGEAAAAPPGAAGQMLLFFGASALAVFGLDTLGYPLTAFLLMLFLLRTLGVRRPVSWRYCRSWPRRVPTSCSFDFSRSPCRRG